MRNGLKSLQFLLLSLLCLPPQIAVAQGDLALRQAIDVYNKIGSRNRLIAFMKIGASPTDLRYLNLLNGQVGSDPVPRAYLAGTLVYFRQQIEPLKTIDLERKLFSYQQQRLDLNLPTGISGAIAKLSRSRRSLDLSGFALWLLPWAVADSGPTSAMQAAAMLAVGGLYRCA